VSRVVRELEIELGVDLFHRGRLGLRLTPQGERFLISARKILSSCEEAVWAVKHADETRGKLVVGFIPEVLKTFLGHALKKFRSDHPDAELSVRDMLPGDQITALRNRKIDLAIFANLPPELGEEFDMLVLRKLSLQAVVSAGHPLSGKMAVSLREIEHDTFLTYIEDKFPGRTRYIVKNCERAGFTPAPGRSKAASIVEMLGMIGAGMGVCLMPSDINNHPHPNVAFLPLKDDIEPICRVAAWLPGNENPLLHHFLECLKENVS
jgi:DNA-binding transcriptional LysR family regulator